jgi:hypothetical protein
LIDFIIFNLPFWPLVDEAEAEALEILPTIRYRREIVSRRCGWPRTLLANATISSWISLFPDVWQTIDQIFLIELILLIIMSHLYGIAHYIWRWKPHSEWTQSLQK